MQNLRLGLKFLHARAETGKMNNLLGTNSSKNISIMDNGSLEKVVPVPCAVKTLPHSSRGLWNQMLGL